MLYNRAVKIALWIIAVIFLTAACKNDRNNSNSGYDPVDFDFAKIKERGKLIALTGYNAYSYFIYRGQPMGYEYELVNRLADFLDVEVEFKVEKNIEKMFNMLNEGEGDLIAFNLTVTKGRSQKVAFTHHHNITKQVLVQRRPENWRRMRIHEIEKELIRSPLQLIGKTVHIRKNSAYHERLENLSNEIGGEIKIVEADPDETTESLIDMVASGEIDYTISDENIAELSQSQYPDIDITTEISFPQKIAWAVRKNSTTLLDTINIWIEEMRKQNDYYVIYSKYYKNRNAFRRRTESEYFSKNGSKISKYDDLIKEYAQELGWDWRILASLIYQESQFDPTAKSWAGAQGLMQLMPATAKQYGVEDVTNPYQNLRAGINYLKWLDNYWKEYVADQNERIKFVLASYNIGLGHIQDAMRLAEKYDGDPETWYDNVEKFLLSKSKKKYYNDPVVRNGYALGRETSKYVREIFERYEHYLQFIS